MTAMVHDNLDAAADHLEALAEAEATSRRQMLKCVQQLAEQCPPGSCVSTEALAGLLSMLAPAIE